MCIKKIIVFATTAREMGALSILKDFIQQISNTTYDYSIIVPPELENNLPVISNINYIYLDTSSWLKRIIYDSWKYPLLEIEKYDLCINFQNIPIRTKTKQIVYYHQSLPLSKIKLSPFKKRTLKLWLYKNFYGLFFLKNKKYLNHLIVQAKWIKNSIHNQYSIDSNIITVMKPKVTFPSISDLEKNTIDTDLNNGKIIFFYPASDYEYKNHTIIINAISKIPKKLRDKILIIFTIEKKSKIYREILDNNLSDSFNLIGKIPRNMVFYLYANSDIILFPSLLETYGLPLEEAKLMRKKIIVSDLEYSRDVLYNYDDVIFNNPYDTKQWVSSIQNEIINYKSTRSVSTFNNKTDTDNNQFISIIDKFI